MATESNFIQTGMILNEGKGNSIFKVRELNEFVEWTKPTLSMVRQICKLAKDQEFQTEKDPLKQDSKFIASYLGLILLGTSYEQIFKPKIKQIIDEVHEGLFKGPLNQNQRVQLISCNFLLGWLELASICKSAMTELHNCTEDLKKAIEKLPQKEQGEIRREKVVEGLEHIERSLGVTYKNIQTLLLLIIQGSGGLLFSSMLDDLDYRGEHVFNALVEAVTNMKKDKEPSQDDSDKASEAG